METMIVSEGFSEYEGEKRVHRAKGDEITVSSERADELRERGLARKKPAARKASGSDTPDTDPGTA